MFWTPWGMQRKTPLAPQKSSAMKVGAPVNHSLLFCLNFKIKLQKSCRYYKKMFFLQSF